MKLRVAMVVFFIGSTLAATPEAARNSDNGCRDDEVQRLGTGCDLTCHDVAVLRLKGKDAGFIKGVFCDKIIKDEGCYCNEGTYRNTADGSCMSWEDCPSRN